MTDYTLTVIDVTGIQSYIFGSNRLAENVGASQLVQQATTTWVRDCLPTAHNLKPDGSIDPDLRMEDRPELNAEVILRGGGNLLILFRSYPLAKEMVGKLTRRLLEQAPGLEIAVAHEPCDWTQPLGGAEGTHTRLYRRLNQAKQQRQRSAPLLGLGVMLECRSTGLPAVALLPSTGADDPGLPVSAEIWAKLDGALQKAADERLTGMLSSATAAGYRFRRDFDALGGTDGEMSYIAVVHADGNGMGKRFKNLIGAYPQAEHNRACLGALRGLSEAVDTAGKEALAATVQGMMQAFRSPAASRELQAFLAGLKQEAGASIIPFRPIVYGGDDVTFVTDGRLGLALAQIYLEEWERAAKALPFGGAAYACAGVAIVKSHYPFVRAYELAEQLCAGAKKKLREAKCEASALDWHFALTGIGGTVEQIRKREYAVKNGLLYLRPVSLRPSNMTPQWYNWTDFDRVTRAFQSDEAWRDRRNKVKELREVLREGGVAVEQFRRNFNLPELPELDQKRQDLQKQGWDGTQCGYFDAIEALDFYLPLPQEA